MLFNCALCYLPFITGLDDHLFCEADSTAVTTPHCQTTGRPTFQFVKQGPQGANVSYR